MGELPGIGVPPPPSASVPAQQVSYAGWRSAEAKKRFSTRAAVSGVVSLIAMYVAPMAVMFPMMFLMMPTMNQRDEVHPGQGCVLDGTLYVPVEKGGAAQVQLDSFSSDGDRSSLGALDGQEQYLLADGSSIWIVSREGVQIYEGGNVRDWGGSSVSGMSRPFLYDGKPAVLQAGMEGVDLLVMDGVDWKLREAFVVSSCDASTCGARLRGIEVDGQLHLFVQSGDTLYHHLGIPMEGEGPEAWVPVGFGEGVFRVVEMGGSPVLFSLDDSNTSSGKLLGYRIEDGQWQEFFSHPIGQVYDLGVWPLDKDGDFALAYRAMMGSVYLSEVRDGTVGEKKKLVSRGGMPPQFLLIFVVVFGMMFLIPMLMGVDLTRVMARDRTDIVDLGDRRMRYASLNRRGVAQLIDGVLRFGGVIAGYGVMMTSLGDIEPGPGAALWPMTSMGLVFGGFGWAILLSLVFCVTEGIWGVTVGKWMVGIRVVDAEDLSAPGVGRAFVRNILEVADCNMNYMVGILAIAFTRKWQRVGDMAARTIVVMKDPVERASDHEGPP